MKICRNSLSFHIIHTLENKDFWNHSHGYSRKIGRKPIGKMNKLRTLQQNLMVFGEKGKEILKILGRLGFVNETC